MIKPVTQKKPYKPAVGCILSGGEYLLRKVDNKEKLGEVLFACAADRNPWKSLDMMGIDVQCLQEAFKYKCPYTDNTFNHFIPSAIVLKNGPSIYRKPPLNSPDFDFMFDMKWMEKVLKGAHPELDEISLTMVGHGYTAGTLPSDGCGG